MPLNTSRGACALEGKGRGPRQVKWASSRRVKWTREGDRRVQGQGRSEMGLRRAAVEREGLGRLVAKGKEGEGRDREGREGRGREGRGR